MVLNCPPLYKISRSPSPIDTIGNAAFNAGSGRSSTFRSLSGFGEVAALPPPIFIVPFGPEPVYTQPKKQQGAYGMNRVDNDKGGFIRRNLIILIFCAMLSSMPLMWLLDGSTQLSPDHSDHIFVGAFVFGIVVAIILSTIIVVVNPPSRYSLLWTTIILFFCVIFFGTLVGMSLISKWYQIAEFSGPQVTRKIEDFAIARAYKTYGKGGCNHIQLRDYFGDFCINRQEYRTVFADAEDTQPSGYCLRAETERNGSAIRIMHSSSWPFRKGAVVRCVQP